jgi:excisionase family DNA binding protein
MDKTNSENNINNLLRASDVARRLNISRSLAYQLMQTGEIRTVRIRGKIVRVYEPDLEQYILNSRTAS